MNEYAALKGTGNVAMKEREKHETELYRKNWAFAVEELIGRIVKEDIPAHFTHSFRVLSLNWIR